MPRERIFSTSSDDLPVLDKLVTGQRGLGVHWTRNGGFVELGTTAVSNDGSDVEVPAHWVTLDWSQCNRLVRFLRAARDQAFGKPE
jgi:hypothetical protein